MQFLTSCIILHSEYRHFEKALYVDICQCTITIRPDDVTSSASKTGCSLQLVVKKNKYMNWMVTASTIGQSELENVRFRQKPNIVHP